MSEEGEIGDAPRSPMTDELEKNATVQAHIESVADAEMSSPLLVRKRPRARIMDSDEESEKEREEVQAASADRALGEDELADVARAEDEQSSDDDHIEDKNDDGECGDDEERRKRRKEKKKKKKKEKKRRHKRLRKQKESAGSSNDEGQDEQNEDEDESEGEVSALKRMRANVQRAIGGGEETSEEDEKEEEEEEENGNVGDEESHEHAHEARAAVPESLLLQEWPPEEDEFTVIWKPIMVLNPTRVLGVALVWVVDMQEEVFFSALRDKISEADAPVVREIWAKSNESVHCCDAFTVLDTMLMSCHGSFHESDVKEFRRRIECRAQKSLHRAWVYMTLEQRNQMGIAMDYSSAIGAYYLRCKASQFEAFGVSAADIAFAACKELVCSAEKRFSAGECKKLAERALCLSKHEQKLCVYNYTFLNEILKRRVIDPEKNISDRSLPCFAGLPLTVCKMACLDCIGVTCDLSKPICENLPMRFNDTLVFKKEKSSTSLAPVIQNIEVMPTYFSGRIISLMTGAYFHSLFYKKIRECGEPNVKITLKKTKEVADDEEEGGLDAEEVRRNQQEQQNAACFEWAYSDELRIFCGSLNGGKAFSTRLHNGVGAVISRVLESFDHSTQQRSRKKNTELLVDIVAVRRAWKLEKRLAEMGEGANLKEKEMKIYVRRFIDWFADGFIHEDEHYSTLARAFGLRQARAMMRTPMENDMYELLSKCPTPHVALFSESIKNDRMNIAKTVKPSFLPWLEATKPLLYATLLKKARHCCAVTASEENVREKLAEVFKTIMRGVSMLDVARKSQERSIILTPAGASDEMLQLCEEILNVADSDQRIVSAKASDGSGDNCLFLVNATDYAVENALRCTLLNAFFYTQLASDEEQSRLLLLRGADADDVYELMKEQIQQCKELLGSVLIVTKDESSDKSVIKRLLRGADADEEKFHIKTFEQVLLCGGHGPVPEKSWPQAYMRVLFFNAHRYVYDEMFQLVATLCGFTDVPKLPRQMTSYEEQNWRADFRMKQEVHPDNDDFHAVYDSLISDFREYAETLASADTYQNTSKTRKEMRWGAENNECGEHSAFVFAFVAFARPDSDAERDYLLLSPAGQCMEDMYFADATSKKHMHMFKTYERYTNSLGKKITGFMADKRLVFLPGDCNVNAVNQQNFISQKLSELERLCVADVGQGVVQEEQERFRRQHEEAARRAAHGGQGVINFAQRDMRFRNAEIMVPQWIDRNAPLPAYLPTVAGTLTREVAPRFMSWRALRTEKRTAVEDQHVRRTRMLMLVSAQPPEETLSNLGHQKASTGQLFVPDVCGFGRAVALELMSRLTNNWAAFILVADTFENTVKQWFVPNTKRVSVSPSRKIPRLRECPSFADDTLVLSRFNLNVALYGSSEFSYYCNLQSSSAFMWAEATKAIADKYYALVPDEEAPEEEQAAVAAAPEEKLDDQMDDLFDLLSRDQAAKKPEKTSVTEEKKVEGDTKMRGSVAMSHEDFAMQHDQNMSILQSLLNRQQGPKANEEDLLASPLPLSQNNTAATAAEYLDEEDDAINENEFSSTRVVMSQTANLIINKF